VRFGVESAQRYLDYEARPVDARQWSAQAMEYGDQAEIDLHLISILNEAKDEPERPDAYFFSQAGRVRRWIDAVASIPPNKLRNLVRMPANCEPPPPGMLLQDATRFALRTIFWAVGSSSYGPGIEECKQFLCPHVLRQTFQQATQSSPLT
jgi:hypothetical protein